MRGSIAAPVVLAALAVAPALAHPTARTVSEPVARSDGDLSSYMRREDALFARALEEELQARSLLRDSQKFIVGLLKREEDDRLLARDFDEDMAGAYLGYEAAHHYLDRREIEEELQARSLLGDSQKLTVGLLKRDEDEWLLARDFDEDMAGAYLGYEVAHHYLNRRAMEELIARGSPAGKSSSKSTSKSTSKADIAKAVGKAAGKVAGHVIQHVIVPAIKKHGPEIAAAIAKHGPTVVSTAVKVALPLILREDLPILAREDLLSILAREDLVLDELD
ncbi:uncharacterized protein FIBRA_05156 [Fibroporia radiculosa]|uniref:Uncharacterized protein n=1 Tax=Fibroporia radiculosa TaxID=599839 RepID=J4H3C6_9APHY|nr:uncharacterized protein FIBRA_05156 [Fibroporia radiculosa]CCM03039.1 predicted protein [Fibroporia radiculosa]